MRLTPSAFPGQLFMYRQKTRLWMPQAGAGQILAEDDATGAILLRVFDVTGGELRPLIAFLPILRSAFHASRPKMAKQLDLPAGWESLRTEWNEKRLHGEAGVFSQPLREVTSKILETVDYLRDESPSQAAVIEIAYPTKSPSGRYDKIVAFVRSQSERKYE